MGKTPSIDKLAQVLEKINRLRKFKETPGCEDLPIFLTPEEAAALLSVKPETLRNWRHLGKGPPYRKIRRKVVYELSDLLEWIDENSIRFLGGTR